MDVNKVIYGDQTLIDLTGDTVTEDSLLKGVTAHAANGKTITGSLITHNVIDNLTSTSTEDALSANQGRILAERIDNIDPSGGVITKLKFADTVTGEFYYLSVENGNLTLSKDTPTPPEEEIATPEEIDDIFKPESTFVEPDEDDLAKYVDINNIFNGTSTYEEPTNPEDASYEDINNLFK